MGSKSHWGWSPGTAWLCPQHTGSQAEPHMSPGLEFPWDSGTLSPGALRFLAELAAPVGPTKPLPPGLPAGQPWTHLAVPSRLPGAVGEAVGTVSFPRPQPEPRASSAGHTVGAPCPQRVRPEKQPGATSVTGFRLSEGHLEGPVSCLPCVGTCDLPHHYCDFRDPSSFLWPRLIFFIGKEVSTGFRLFTTNNSNPLSLQRSERHRE